MKVKLSFAGEKRRQKEARKRKGRGEASEGPLRAADFLATLPRRERRKALLEPTVVPCVWFCPSTDLYYLFHGEGGGEVFSRPSYSAVVKEVIRLTGIKLAMDRDRPPGVKRQRAVRDALRPDLMEEREARVAAERLPWASDET